LSLMATPETRYARTGDAYIAYQIVGEGDVDFLMRSYGNISIDAFDREPHVASFLRRLGRCCRIIRYDTRGIGLSDPIAPESPPTLEQEVADALAVLDDAGSKRAAIFGAVWAGPMAIVFAATHPTRTAALILCNTYARATRAEDYPIGPDEEWMTERIAQVTEPAADVDTTPAHAPSLAGDEAFRLWWRDEGRRGASPRTAQALMQVSLCADVRDVLPSIRVPTLVVGRQELVGFEDRAQAGRWLAEHIEGARFVELPGTDAFPFAQGTQELVGEIEELLTGARGHDEPNRVLATLLFTDIVESTGRAASVGDVEWRELLDRHDAMVRRQIERFVGREIKTTGDGFLLTFDGPARAVRCATAIRDGALQLGIDIRAGVHTGEVELRGDDVSGIAVHLAQRVSGCAGAGQIIVSSTVKDLVFGSGIDFSDAGARELKGIPGTWQLFEVKS
jgi:class 3 adenylate cyclase